VSDNKLTANKFPELKCNRKEAIKLSTITDPDLISYLRFYSSHHINVLCWLEFFTFEITGFIRLKF